MARIYHPDKSSGTDKTSAEKFNIIHQAYTILSNTESRKTYDEEGSEVLFVKPTVAAQWEKYLKTISTENFNDASNSYKGSAEERVEILREFVNGKGSMIHIFNTVPFVRRGDEIRIIKIIQEAIEAEEVSRITIKKLPKNY